MGRARRLDRSRSNTNKLSPSTDGGQVSGRRPSAGLPGLPRATTVECGPDTFAILSCPMDELPLPDSLSAAEKEVCLLLLAGATNAEVAERRRTAVRTVANQVASILRKLGAGSRSELPRALARHGQGQSWSEH